MNRRHLVGIIILSVKSLIASETTWPFEDHYRDSMLYIHAVANYELHPTWREQWQINQYRQNMLRLNFASISMDDMLSDAHLAINEKLAPGLWFRYFTKYYATRHRNEQEKYTTLGFEKSIYRSFSAFVYGNPHFEKEEIDIQYGLSLSSSNRRQYLRLAYIEVDPFWDAKNDQYSTSLEQPWGLLWETNVSVGKFRFFSRGRYDAGLSRAFLADSLARGLRAQYKKINDFFFALYYYTGSSSFIESSYSGYVFNEKKSFKEGDKDYDYQNSIQLLKLAFVSRFYDRWRLRFGSHFVLQDARSKLYREHDYRRREIIPFLFVELSAGPGIVEAGYMGAVLDWSYMGFDDNPNRYTHQEYVDKIKLAYTFHIKEKAYLQFAVSHVTAIWGFGGGNVQFWLDF